MGENSSASEEKTQKARNRMTNVYIWDMDETLILLKSLLNGAFAEAFNGSKDVKKGVELGRMWEDHILKMCDDYFFYEQVSLQSHLIFPLLIYDFECYKYESFSF